MFIESPSWVSAWRWSCCNSRRAFCRAVPSQLRIQLLSLDHQQRCSRLEQQPLGHRWRTRWVFDRLVGVSSCSTGFRQLSSSTLHAAAGPVLLEDYQLIEKIAQFDRERIPERVVHARGASAKGFFEVTHDVSGLSCADFLRAPGVQTPVIVRFSTVIHERGSPETLRDPRGFAVKFYTREGNWDLVRSLLR